MRNGLYVASDGTCEWYVNGVLHRTDGPAIERADGTCGWWLNGERHRVDGPAIEYANGKYWWYLCGESYSFHEWLRVNTKLTPQQKTVLMLKYGDQ